MKRGDKPFIIAGQEVIWPRGPKTPPEPVQKVLNAWKTGQPIDQFIGRRGPRLKSKLIRRIERTTGHLATPEQLADLDLSREQIDAISELRQTVRMLLNDDS